MAIVIDEVVSEITPPVTSTTEAPASATEPSGQDSELRKLLDQLRRHERRQQRLMAD